MSTAFTLLFGLFTSVCTVIVGKVLDGFFKEKAEKRELLNLSITLKDLFEGYAVDCTNLVEQHDFAVKHQETAGRLIVEIPNIAMMPNGTAWNLLDSNILQHVLEFPSLIQVYNFHLSSISSSVADKDEIKKALRKSVVQLGFTALGIALLIKDKQKIQDKEPIPKELFDKAERSYMKRLIALNKAIDNP